MNDLSWFSPACIISPGPHVTGIFLDLNCKKKCHIDDISVTCCPSSYIKITTSCAVSAENVVKMTFLFQCVCCMPHDNHRSIQLRTSLCMCLLFIAFFSSRIQPSVCDTDFVLYNKNTSYECYSIYDINSYRKEINWVTCGLHGYWGTRNKTGNI